MQNETIERVEIKLPASVKQLLSQAAEINGSTMTALILSAAMDKAWGILQAHQLFTLNTKDWQAFMEVLENYPEPNEALQQAWAEYHGEDLNIG